MALALAAEGEGQVGAASTLSRALLSIVLRVVGSEPVSRRGRRCVQRSRCGSQGAVEGCGLREAAACWKLEWDKCSGESPQRHVRSPQVASGAEMAQLRQICRDQIMEEVLWSINPGHRPAAARERGAPEPHGAAAYKVLVLDGFATRIISSCCKMSDITDAGVSHVENLAVRRQPLPMLEAIYFVAPTSESVAAIGRDFQGRRKPQYARAHIVFTGHLPDSLLQQISQNRNLCSRIAALKELNMEFLAVEDAVFSVEMKNAFYDLHAVPAPAGKAATQAKMAQRLASLCVTLGSQHGDLPLIRYDRASVVASEVASALGVSE